MACTNHDHNAVLTCPSCTDHDTQHSAEAKMLVAMSFSFGSSLLCFVGMSVIKYSSVKYI